MRNSFILLTVAILLVNCTTNPKSEKENTPQEEPKVVIDPKIALIADYAQTTGNTKTDLAFEMISIEKGKDIIARDSLMLYYHSWVNDYEGNMSVDEFVSHLKPYYEKYPQGKAGVRYKALSKYYTDQERVISKGYNCKYKIKNPYLNMAVQEIDRTFYLSPDETKVLGNN